METWALGTIVMSIQDSKPHEKQISPTFSYFLINNALLYHFLANWLAHNKKMTKKSVFREAWSPELTSQSFPVSCFWCRGFVPHRKWNLTLLAHQNTGKENRYRKKVFATLISTLGDLIKEIKKIFHIHFKQTTTATAMGTSPMGILAMLCCTSLPHSTLYYV